MDMQSLREFWHLVKQVWQDGIFGIDIGEILTAIAILLVFVVFRGLFSRIIMSRVQKWVDKTENTLDDSLVEALQSPIKFIPVVVGVFFGTTYLTLSDEAQLFFNNVNRSLIAFTIFWSLYMASVPLSNLLMGAKNILTTSMIQWIAKSIRLAFALVGAATILEIWGIEVGALLAGLGLFGVAVALGAQDLFKNLIAGLFIIGEQRFSPGDWIFVKGVVEGTVEEIGFRTTTIRRFDKAPVYVPNASLADHAVTNFSRMTYRRIKWVIGLTYGSSKEQLETVRAGIEKYITDNKDFVRPDETASFVRIDQFSDSSIDILLYCFTRTTNWLDWMEIKEKLLLEIKDLVDKNDAGFAFPSRSLYLEAIGEDIEVAPLHLINERANSAKGAIGSE